MMRARMWRKPAVVAGLVTAVLCVLTGGASAADEGDWTIAAWVCADGDLTPLAAGYVSGLMDGAARGDWQLAVQTDSGNAPVARRARTAVGVVSGDAVAGGAPCSMGSRESLADFLSWTVRLAPAEHLALVVFGHGTTAAGRGHDGRQVADGAVVALDQSSRDGLTAREVAAAAHDALGPEGSIDVVVLDCCYGSSVEVAWDLRDGCDALVACPGRMPAVGLPWRELLATVRPSECANGDVFARRLVAGADQVMPGGTPALAAVQPGRVEEVARSVALLSAAVCGGIEQATPALTLARSRCLSWGAGREACDLWGLCRELAVVAEDEVAGAAARVARDAQSCLIYARGLRPGEALGLTISIPTMMAPAGGGTCEFAVASGWGQLTALYHVRLRELMQRTDGDATDGEAAA